MLSLTSEYLIICCRLLFVLVISASSLSWSGWVLHGPAHCHVSMLQVLQDVCSSASAADSEHGYSTSAPGWHSLQEALQEAAKAAEEGRQELDAAAQAIGSSSAALVAQGWQQGMQAAIRHLLLWAQAQKQTEGAGD